MLDIFVYGTLKPGEINYQIYCHQVAIASQIAYARGQLFDLPLGYPAMTVGNNWIEGYVLTFAQEDILVSLDILEEYDEKRSPQENEYYRSRILVYAPSKQPLKEAWSYLMTPEKVKQLKGLLLPSGFWHGSKHFQ
jgi:gamma-glutamylcyclotransferase (GGCT)/AIG2-like uncharacterized protein YtfP